MASCVMNIRTKNYPNLLIGFQVTVENVGDVFETHGIYRMGHKNVTLYFCSYLRQLLIDFHNSFTGTLDLLSLGSAEAYIG